MILGNPITLGSAKKKGRLPDEYQEVEYLRFTGGQYLDNINISYIVGEYPALHIEYIIREIKSYGPYIFSGRGENRTHLFNRSLQNGTKSQLRFGDNYVFQNSAIVPPVNIYITIDAKNGSCGASYITDAYTYAVANETAAESIIIGAWSGGTQDTNYLFVGDFYNFGFGYGLSETINLVPCYMKATSKPGAYDTINNTFYTNAGTGEFIVGPAVN